MGSLKTGLEFGIPFPGLDAHASVIFTNSLIVIAIILIVSIIITRKLSLRNPSKSQMVIEMTLKWLANMMDEIIGEGGNRFLPIIASLFLYILFANIIGIIPGFVSPTSNININFGLALIVFFATPYVGIKLIGLKNYFKHKLGPVLFIAPLIFVVETIGEFFRPVSLTLRLYGNIMGEEILIMVFNKIASMIYWVPITVIFLPLSIITSFLQAFIFTILPIIYFAGAAGWGEEH